jgi:hypothetical protein
MPSSARHDRLEPVGERLLRAGDGEERQTRAVEHQHEAAQAIEHGIPEEGHQAGEEGDSQIAPVADRGRRDGADQQVSGETTRVGGGEGQDEHAEQIEPALTAAAPR